MEKYIQMSKAKAAARVSQPCMDQLPLAMNLLCFQKGKSFIDKKHCLNEYCFWNFHFQVTNYASEVKLTLLKSDNEQRHRCSKCNNQRHCAVYQCKICEFVYCYYCLIDASKRLLFANIGQRAHTIVLQSQKEAKSFKFGQRVGVLKILNESQSSLFEEIEEKKIKGMDKKELDLIGKNFGKYRDQYLLFKCWEMPNDFFSIQPSWVANHYKVDPFDYLKYSHLSPKIHEPDRLECELVSIKKHNNFVYEGQVLVTS